MSAEETAEFENEEHWPEACRLRRWDDLGKVPGADVPPLEHYRAVLEAVAISDP
jgi:predicted HD phosphohydrolase